MKRFLLILMCLCMVMLLAACGGTTNVETPEEQLASYKQAYEDFKTDWNSQKIIAVNARVVTDVNGDRMIMADVKNNSSTDVSAVVLSFAAWDSEGNFITIKSRNNPTNTFSEFQMEVGDVTITGGETWTANLGVFLSTDCPDIAYIEAAVVSYNESNSVCDNPLYNAWKETYLGQYLEDWMRAGNT